MMDYSTPNSLASMLINNGSNWSNIDNSAHISPMNFTTVKTENSIDESPYYGEYFTEFRENYTPIHGWISVFVCMFGIIANILNIMVLTRYSLNPFFRLYKL
jgi:hypothetical protein